MAERQGARRPRGTAADTAVIQLAKNLELDRRAATQKFGIIGRSESGKTYLAGKLVEGLHAIGCQVIVFDPIGNWWGLTLAANGTDPGLPFVVFGGRRGHLPLRPDDGRRIARLVIERNLNAVLDLTGLRKRRPPGRGGEPESELQKFVADFEEEALEASQHHPKPRSAVYDEAHKMLPQVLKDGGNRMLDAGEDLVRTGRNYGWGCVLMSQRPQSINKEVLSQVECFFVGQLTEAPARARLGEWIVEKDVNVKRELDELAQLERGQFYCWSPQWLRRFDKIRVLPKVTFDASRTPEVGELVAGGVPSRSSISDTELAALRAALERAAVPEKAGSAGANGVRLRELEQARAAAEREAAELRREMTAQRQALNELYERLGVLLSRPATPAAVPAGLDEGPPAATVKKIRGPEPGRRAAPRQVARSEGGDGRLEASGLPSAAPVDKCQRAIMTVLIQHGRALSMKQLGMMAVYAPTSGGFKNAVSKLRKRAWLEGRGDVTATARGGDEFVTMFGAVQNLPRGDKLFEFWLRHRRVDKCGRAVMTALREVRGGAAVSPEQLARSTDPPYAAGSGGFKNTLSKLRTLGVIEGRGEVRLTAELRRG